MAERRMALRNAMHMALGKVKASVFPFHFFL